MALNNDDQAQIRQYLLGKLSEAEQEKIEERLMVENDLFDEFEASKDELVEEYYAGELGRNEREWLENHFLASAEGIERHAFAATMDHMRRRQSQPAPHRVTPPPAPTIFERMAAFLKAQPWALATVTSVVLVVVVAFIWFRGAQGKVFEATLNSAALKRGTEAPQPSNIQLPPNTSQLKLRLQLPKPAPAGTTYNAVLDDRVNTNKIEVVATDPQSVTVLIPRKQLPRGWYTLELTATSATGNVQQLSYPFNVE